MKVDLRILAVIFLTIFSGLVIAQDEAPAEKAHANAAENEAELKAKAALQKAIIQDNEAGGNAKAAKVAKEELALELYKDKIEIYEGKAYKKKGIEFPWQLKCTSVDRRTFHGCLEPRFFDPSARVYFDNGSDGPDKVDIFNNGNLNVALDFVSIYVPWRLGKGEFYDSWSWGPMAGLGISASAKDSPDGTNKASEAPVVLASVGFMLEYKFGDDGPSFGIELGESFGFSSDEKYGNNKDQATYVGLKLNIPTQKRDAPH